MRDRDSDRGRGRDRDDDRGSRRGSDRDDDRGSRRGRDDDRSSRGSGSSKGFQYQTRSAEDRERRASMGANEFDRFLKDNIKVWTPKKGINTIRILPPTWDKARHYGHDIYVHYGVGPDRQSYLDLNKMRDEPDPITEEREALRRSGDADEDEIKAMDSKRRVLVYIIDRDKESEGPQAWAMPWTVDKDITKLSVDRKTGESVNIDDPEEGFDISFEKTGDGARTKYEAVSIERNPSSLGKTAWLDFAVDNPLPDQLQFYSYDEIAKAFGGGGAHRDRTDRDDDRGSRRSSSRDESDDRDAPRGRGSRDDSDDRGARGSDREGRSSDRRGRDDDEPPRRGRRSETDDARDADPKLTWESVHEMTADELDALCESDDRLSRVKPNDAKDDEELADWICEDLGLKKEEAPKRERVRATTPQEDPEDKMAEMRRRRAERDR